MTLVVSDFFVRADENPLASPWAKPSGMAALKLASNGVLVTAASTDCWAYRSDVSLPTHQWARTRVKIVGGSDFGPIVWCSDTDDGYMATAYDLSNIYIFRVLNNNFTELVNFAGTLAVGDWLELQVDKVTTTAVLKVLKNGVQVGTDYVDNTPLTETVRVGMHGYDATGTIDGFEAGDFNTATNPTITLQPVNTSGVLGATAAFTVAATSSGGTLHYQWKKNGTVVGTDSASYTTSALTNADNTHSIVVRVTDDNGFIDSNTVTLTVIQVAYPDADIVDGAWTPSGGADLYAVIDDASDADYITVNSNSECEIGVGTLETPISGTRTFEYRIQGAANKALVAGLYDGATLVEEWTTDPCPAALTTLTRTIANAFGSYGDVRVRFKTQAAASPPTTAVTFGAIGTAGTLTNTTSHAVNYPSGITAASKLYLFMTGVSSTAATEFAITGGGWTLVGTREGGSGASYAADVGNRRVSVFRKDTVSGSESGSITVTLAGSATNTIFGSIVRFEVPSTYTIAEEFTSASDTSAGTGYSATGSASLTWAAGDLLAVLVASSTDTATQSSQAISASGVTFGTRTNQRSSAVTGGNDHRQILDTVPVTTGSGSSAPTYSYTASASTSGPAAFLRLRAVPPTEAARVTQAVVKLPAGTSGSPTYSFPPYFNRAARYAALTRF
jgi:hypothetical protein